MDLMIAENNKLIRKDIITQKSGYNVSSRYIAIATQDILTEIEAYTGTAPIITGFNNTNVRKIEKNGFQKHALICEMPNSELIDGTKMNIILFNSNDRSTSLKIFMGAIRMACSNQCVWGNQIAEPVSIRHTQKDWKYSIHKLMDSFNETQNETREMIKRMMNSYLSYGDIGKITERVANEILSPEIVGQIFDPMQLNNAFQRQDIGKDAWHTFNRIQYNLLNGGIDRSIEKADDKGILFDLVSKTHKVTDISKQINFNKKLHSLIMEAI